MELVVPSWAELEAGLLAEIAKRIGRLFDYASFATVCSSWRKAALLEERCRRPLAHFPGLLIASRRREKKQGDRFLPVGEIRSYLGNQKSKYSLRRTLLQPAAAAEEWDCRGTQEGWVIMVKPYVNNDGDRNNVINVTLRNPLTHVDIPLPPLHLAYGVNTWTKPLSWRVEKAVLSSSPGPGSSGRCYVLMFYDVGEFVRGWSVQGWRHVEFTQMPMDHQDNIAGASTTGGSPPAMNDREAIYLDAADSSFYILNRGILHLLDPAAADMRTAVVCRIEGKLPFRQTKWRECFHLNHHFYSEEAGCSVVPHFHLAELGGELAVIVRLVGYDSGEGELGFRKFYTWRRLENRQGYYWNEAGDLGGAALFVGTSQGSFGLRPAGLNVREAESGVRRDHIYFALLSHANVSGIELGQYNYHHRTVHLFKFEPPNIRWHDADLPHLRRPYPLWFLPMPWRPSTSIDGKSMRKRNDHGEEICCTCATIHSLENGEGDDDDDEQYALAANTNRFEALLTL